MDRDGCHHLLLTVRTPARPRPQPLGDRGQWLPLQVPTVSIFSVKGSPSLRGIFIFILRASPTFC